ncbi:hypothetical protein CSB45_14160 [candidate division KSB3 bacterium]|uniref:Tripartite ATP-independent periplasmic transporters DctQ component domain-containing protein n=1 Tax=candidate division KSB3 bacterium TaxID=2044937 RepID=A0A2G6E1D2_9BACT|nr:MAG: hypothetical protein CSB45_14160 [candidate division KSB3 bacterium]PIE28470.1 MAG: hypothetical protein CSA57_13805 [candidate division KSB3 bacterium]
MNMQHIVKIMNRVLDACVGGLLAVMLFVASAQVISRYILKSSLVWSEELTRLLYVWMIMLAAVRASHMRIEILVKHFGKKLQLAVETGCAVISAAILLFMVHGALFLATLTAGDTYTGLKLSVKYVFLALVCAGSLWSIAIIAHAAERAWGDLRKQEERPW